MARDWRFPPASFRGATFYVDTSAPSGGRRKAIHEYPGSEYWDVEDLGTKAKKITLTAYFVSETSDTDYAVLIAACDQSGPSQLILPFFGAVTASAETWDPSWSQEKLNYVGGSFTFIIENPAGAPIALGLGERIMASTLATASSTIGNAVTALFTGISSTSFQRSDAASYLVDASTFVETVRQSTLLPDTTSSSVQIALGALPATATTAVETDPGTYIASTLEQFDAIAIDATADDAAPTFQTAAALAVTFVPATLIPQPDPSQAAASIPAALAVAATMQAIRLTASATYTDRTAAITARSMIAEMAVAVLPFLGALGARATEALTDLWGQAVEYLTAVITNLAPVVLIESNMSLPSTVLAYRLYGDPNRGAELVARNRIATPLFMPTLFEAASS